MVSTLPDTQALILARIQDVDRRDEDQILALLSGEIITEYVYSFQDGAGRRQEGLSWAGVRELAAMRGNIILDQPIIEEHEDHWRVMIKATDLDRNISVWGGTHQPKKLRRRDGSEMDDPYAYEKSLSKAQRNAIKNLIPITVVKGAIANLRKLQSRAGSEEVDEETGEIQQPRRGGQRRQPNSGQQQNQPSATWDDAAWAKLITWATGEGMPYRTDKAVIEALGCQTRAETEIMYTTPRDAAAYLRDKAKAA